MRFAFLAVDHVVLDVILLFQNVSGWISLKIMRKLEEVQKGKNKLSHQERMKLVLEVWDS